MNYNSLNSSLSREHKSSVRISKNSFLAITPPTSKKENLIHDSSPKYSLFESPSPSQFWLRSALQQGTPLLRKHSVSVDGSDSLFAHMKYKNNSTDFRRRASLPNNSFFMMSSYSCSVCILPFCFNDYFLQTGCAHLICKNCSSSNSSSCPLCLTRNGVSVLSSLVKKETYHPPSSQSNREFNSYGVPIRDHSSNLSPDLIYLEEEDESFYIGDLLSSRSLESSFTISQVENPMCCVTLSNIPFDVSQKDIKLFFGDQVELPCSTTHAQSIHIMMDRVTGKTQPHCYVEFASVHQALRAIQYGNKRPIKGRIINISFCPMDELLSSTFPSWKTGFTNSKANQVLSQNSPNSYFITRDEVKSLLIICKNYKLHFSRKCAERPFENIITIVTKYPWEQHNLVSSSSQQEEIFNLLKLSIDTLKIHLAKEFIQIDRSLLDRMVNAGILCPGFTDSRKSILLQTADKLLCPADFKSLALWNSQEQSKQGNLQSRKQQHSIDESYMYFNLPHRLIATPH